MAISLGSGLDLNKLKQDIQNSSQGFGKKFFVKSGSTRRVRFLTNIQDGHSFKFHTSYELGITVMCLKEIDKECDCPFCSDPRLKFVDLYVWSVWDYDDGMDALKIMVEKNTRCSPVPQLIALQETFGTITDRDLSIGVVGEKTSKAYNIIGLDRSSFNNANAIPYSREAIVRLLKQINPITQEACQKLGYYVQYAEDGTSTMTYPNYQSQQVQPTMPQNPPQQTFIPQVQNPIGGYGTAPQNPYMNATQQQQQMPMYSQQATFLESKPIEDFRMAQGVMNPQQQQPEQIPFEQAQPYAPTMPMQQQMPMYGQQEQQQFNPMQQQQAWSQAMSEFNAINQQVQQFQPQQQPQQLIDSLTGLPFN